MTALPHPLAGTILRKPLIFVCFTIAPTISLTEVSFFGILTYLVCLGEFWAIVGYPFFCDLSACWTALGVLARSNPDLAHSPVLP
jgi:hypothetical protein